jgi:hypothetical protein
MTTASRIDNYEDLIDVRDIIDAYGDAVTDEDSDTADTLDDLLADLRGNGGDHEWRGDWYPVTLIRDSYFTEYAQSFAEDIGLISDTATGWPYTCIDWDRAARELQMDYTSVEYDGITYWYR